MVVLNIHHEGMDPKNFLNGDMLFDYRHILDTGVPVVISPSLHNYKEGQWKNFPEIIPVIKRIVSREGSFLGQQGFTHKCRFKHRITDKWHEFYCPWHPGTHMSVDHQSSLMKAGKRELEDLFDVEVKVFVPPNHSFDENTLRAAEYVGYKYFTDSAVIAMQPYRFSEKMTIVPEGNLFRGRTEGREMVYVHYDQINSCFFPYEQILDSLSSLNNIKVGSASPDLRKLNATLKYGYKYVRDLRKMPKRAFASLSPASFS